MKIAPTNSDEFLGDETYRFLGGISDGAWSDLEAGRPANVSQLGVTDLMRSLLASETRPVIGEQEVSDLKHHPIELYNRDDVDATSVTMQSQESVLFRMQSAGNR